MAEDLLKLMQQWLAQLDKQAPAAADEALLHSWQQFFGQSAPPGGTALPPQQAEVLALLTRQSVEFTRFANQILEQLDPEQELAELSPIVNAFHDHLRRLTQEWILQRWQLPEQLGALFRTHSFQDDLLLDNPFIHGLKSLLSTPALLGLNHELQQQLRAGVDLLLEYEQALAEYSAHYSDINKGATTAFIARIEASEPAISTLGALHDLWVESYEQRYLQQVHTDTYRQAHGRISNAVMQLRLFLQQLRNQQLQQLGIPNSTQLEQIFQRLNTQRKTIKTLKREVEQLPDMQQQIDELRAEIKSLRQEHTTPPAARTRRKKGAQ